MKIRDVMTRGVEAVPPDAPICEAARKMKKADVGVVPVTDGQKVVGMVTDRDLAVRAVAEARDPSRTPVRDVMTSHVRFCHEDDSIEDAAEMMERDQIRRLAVLDRDERLAGMVSLGDLSISTGDHGVAGEVLNRVSQPSRPQART